MPAELLSTEQIFTENSRFVPLSFVANDCTVHSNYLLWSVATDSEEGDGLKLANIS